MEKPGRAAGNDSEDRGPDHLVVADEHVDAQVAEIVGTGSVAVPVLAQHPYLVAVLLQEPPQFVQRLTGQVRPGSLRIGIESGVVGAAGPVREGGPGQVGTWSAGRRWS